MPARPVPVRKEQSPRTPGVPVFDRLYLCDDVKQIQLLALLGTGAAWIVGFFVSVSFSPPRANGCGFTAVNHQWPDLVCLVMTEHLQLSLVLIVLLLLWC